MNQQFQAFLVGGPANGTTMWLDHGTTEWRHISQRLVRSLSELRDEQPMASLSSVRYHEYRCTKEMSYAYLRGCFIFEWMGEK